MAVPNPLPRILRLLQPLLNTFNAQQQAEFREAIGEHGLDVHLLSTYMRHRIWKFIVLLENPLRAPSGADQAWENQEMARNDADGALASSRRALLAAQAARTDEQRALIAAQSLPGDVAVQDASRVATTMSLAATNAVNEAVTQCELARTATNRAVLLDPETDGVEIAQREREADAAATAAQSAAVEAERQRDLTIEAANRAEVAKLESHYDKKLNTARFVMLKKFYDSNKGNALINSVIPLVWQVECFLKGEPDINDQTLRKQEYGPFYQDDSIKDCQKMVELMEKHKVLDLNLSIVPPTAAISQGKDSGKDTVSSGREIEDSERKTKSEEHGLLFAFGKGTAIPSAPKTTEQKTEPTGDKSGEKPSEPAVQAEPSALAVPVVQDAPVEKDAKTGAAKRTL